MADLVTHLCSALFPAAVLRLRHPGPLAVGAVLPDLTSRLPGLSLQMLDRFGLPIPEVVYYPFAVGHVPLGAALVCVPLAYLFPLAQRGGVLVWLLAGSALHFALDVPQDHHGHGYLMLFPFSTRPWELGWIGSEATVLWAPWLTLITAIAWWARRRYP